MKDKLKTILFGRRDIPKAGLLREAIESFSLTEKTVFYSLIAIMSISVLYSLKEVNTIVSVRIPKFGGTLTEGIIGSPRFINPLLAISDSDRDLTALVYSGLMKATPDGELIPELAEKFVSENGGKTYTFTLKDNIFFHDGKPVTADDIVFTIQKAEDPILKSPKRADWEGVSVEKVDDKTVRFNLKQAYPPFLENTTIGILPKHLWKEIEPEQYSFNNTNIKPVGSGPFKFSGIKYNSSGSPVEIDLEAFSKYSGGRPHLKKLVIRFYQNEKSLISAYRSGEVESVSGISPKEATELKKAGSRIESISLPRIFGVFFNQNRAQVLSEKEVRQALSVAVDKTAIVNEVLAGYGKPIWSPIPSELLRDKTTGNDANPMQFADQSTRVTEAKKILSKAGWKLNTETGVMEKKVAKETKTLTFSISTSNTPELRKTAEMLKDFWQSIGAKIEVKLFEVGEINQSAIRPRKYDSLLFGEIIGRDLDLFAFWHSSQRNDPGLNIALYTNNKADKLLEDGRSTEDKEDRAQKYIKFEEEIMKDLPAVFIYSPNFIYVLPEKIKGLNLSEVTVPSERFMNVGDWYIETELVWKIFASKENLEQYSTNY